MNSETKEWFAKYHNHTVTIGDDFSSSEIKVEEMYRMFRDRMASELSTDARGGSSVFVTSIVLRREHEEAKI